jgi:voltage-gated potassium channel
LQYPNFNFLWQSNRKPGNDWTLTLNHRAHWRDKLHEIIFGHSTFAGRLFDLALLILIILGVLTVLLDSVRNIHDAYGPYLEAGEWIVTGLFTVEYAARLACAPSAWRYATSFFGIVDLLAILPVYLGVFFGITHTFTLVRTLRLLRVFRILKLTQFLGEATVLKLALRASLPKITVFLFTVLTAVILVGAMMYQIESEQNGFTSIPTAMYWAIVTVTTVGYGDISPHTVLGRFIASILMVLGYGIIAVPTGIFSFELARTSSRPALRLCPGCALTLHDTDASHCKHCGQVLPSAS